MGPGPVKHSSWERPGHTPSGKGLSPNRRVYEVPLPLGKSDCLHGVFQRLSNPRQPQEQQQQKRNSTSSADRQGADPAANESGGISTKPDKRPSERSSFSSVATNNSIGNSRYAPPVPNSSLSASASANASAHTPSAPLAALSMSAASADHDSDRASGRSSRHEAAAAAEPGLELNSTSIANSEANSSSSNASASGSANPVPSIPEWIPPPSWLCGGKSTTLKSSASSASSASTFSLTGNASFFSVPIRSVRASTSKVVQNFIHSGSRYLLDRHVKVAVPPKRLKRIDKKKDKQQLKQRQKQQSLLKKEAAAAARAAIDEATALKQQQQKLTQSSVNARQRLKHAFAKLQYNQEQQELLHRKAQQAQDRLDAALATKERVLQEARDNHRQLAQRKHQEFEQHLLHHHEQQRAKEWEDRKAALRTEFLQRWNQEQEDRKRKRVQEREEADQQAEQEQQQQRSNKKLKSVRLKGSIELAKGKVEQLQETRSELVWLLKQVIKAETKQKMEIMMKAKLKK